MKIPFTISQNNFYDGVSMCYLYSFNGKEKDDETNTQNYGMRISNPRLARFLSVDPLTKSYPWYTPYQFAGNKPIWAIDLDGKEEFIQIDYYNSCGDLYATKIKIISSGGMKNDGGKNDKQVVYHKNVYFKDDNTFTMTKEKTTRGTTTGVNAFDTNKQRKDILNRDQFGEPIKYILDKPIPFKPEGQPLPEDLITKRSTQIGKLASNQTVAKKIDVYYNDENKVLKMEQTQNDTYIFNKITDPKKYSKQEPAVKNALPEQIDKK